MPPDQGVRLDDCQEPTPVEEPREDDQRDPRDVVGATRPDLSLQVQSQLFTQKEVLRSKLRSRLASSRHELKDNADKA